MRMRGLILLLGLVVAASSAFADFTWEFASDAEGWEQGDTSSWGAKGCTMAWAADDAGDGKLVMTFDGGFSEATTSAEFNPVMFRFFWNDPQAWQESAPGDGGATGRYMVLRYKVTGTAAPAADPVWARLDPYVERWCTGGVTRQETWWVQPILGEWVTEVVELETDVADPTERLTISFGSADHHSWEFFKDAGSSVEIDWVKFVDDPAPYLTHDFNAEVAPWTDQAAIFGLDGFQSLTLGSGIMTATFENAPYSAGLFVPVLYTNYTHLKPQATSPLYVHMRCRVNCDPGLASMPALVVYNEGEGWAGPGADFSDALQGLSVPTNAWTTVSWEISGATGYATSNDFGELGLYLGFTDLSALPGLLDGNIEVDYIRLSTSPVADPDSDSDGISDDTEADSGLNAFDDDTDGDGLVDGWEVDNSLDPLDDGSVDVNNGADGDPDGDGFSNFIEQDANSDPQDINSVPPATPVSAPWGLALTALALMGVAGLAYRLRRA